MTSFVYALTLASALGTGLVAGVFFAFSTFVMRALSRLPPAQGIAAMQSINVAVMTPWFMGVFMGVTLTSLALTVLGLAGLHRPGGALLLAGGLLYLAGTFLVTAVVHVPRNDALAAAVPTSAGGASLWASYLAVWTAWNHVRTIAALASSACLVVALCQSRAR